MGLTETYVTACEVPGCGGEPRYAVEPESQMAVVLVCNLHLDVTVKKALLANPDAEVVVMRRVRVPAP